MKPCRTALSQFHVIFERERHARRRFGKGFVERLQVLRMHVVFERIAAILFSHDQATTPPSTTPGGGIFHSLWPDPRAREARRCPDMPSGAARRAAALFDGELLQLPR